MNTHITMKIKLILLLVFAIALQCFAINDLLPYQKAAIATRFASEVEYNFAGYDKFAQNYDSICRAELPNLVNTQSDEEFSEKLQLEYGNQFVVPYIASSTAQWSNTYPFNSVNLTKGLYLSKPLRPSIAHKSVQTVSERLINFANIKLPAKWPVETFVTAKVEYA